MNKCLVRLVVFVSVLAAVLLLVAAGCPVSTSGGGGGDSYIPIGSAWQNIDVSGGADDEELDDGDIMWLIAHEPEDPKVPWYMVVAVYEGGDPPFTALVEFKGTYTLTADTWTLTLTHVRSYYYGYDDWYDDSYWETGGTNFDALLNNIYDEHWFDWAGDPTVAIPYDFLPGDEDTLYMEIDGDWMPFERVL